MSKLLHQSSYNMISKTLLLIPFSKVKIILVLYLCILFSCANAQNVYGLWEVKQVIIADQVMTPQAKWFHIYSDGNYESGNGWLKNSEGVYTYDTLSHNYLPIETNGIVDPFGAFKVSFEDGNMIWERDEEGMLVTIELERINKLPKSPADKVVGLWQLTDISREGLSIIRTFDPEGDHYLFIRWDRILQMRDQNGKQSRTYWHMNGHRPEITLMETSILHEDETWKVEATDTELTLIGISESNRGEERVYSRLNEFPE